MITTSIMVIMITTSIMVIMITSSTMVIMITACIMVIMINTSRTDLATGKPEPQRGGATVAGTSSSYEPRLISKNGVDNDDDDDDDSMFKGYLHICHLVFIITITNHLHILPLYIKYIETNIFS